MQEEVKNINKVKSIINLLPAVAISALAVYFSLLFFGYNSKINSIIFAIFSIGLFLIFEIIIFPSKNYIKSLISFCIYFFVIALVTFPFSILYSLTSDTTSLIVYSEISSIISISTSYLITKLVNKLIVEQPMINQLDSESVSNEENIIQNKIFIKSNEYQFENEFGVKKLNNILVNNNDLINIIEKNALMQHLDNKTDLNILPLKYQNQFKAVTEKLHSEKYDTVLFINSSGNLLFSSGQKKSYEKDAMFFSMLIDYILEITNIVSEKSMKTLKLFLFDYMYEVSRLGEFILIKGINEAEISSEKFAKEKKLDAIISELIKNISGKKVNRVEISSLNGSIAFV